jgi:hypothetical protein
VRTRRREPKLRDDPVMLGPINILKLKFSPEG